MASHSSCKKEGGNSFLPIPVRKSLFMHQSMTSKNLEKEIEDRYEEATQFKDCHHGAITSPILSRILVHRTECHIKCLEEISSPATQASFSRFKSVAITAKVCCFIGRKWKCMASGDLFNMDSRLIPRHEVLSLKLNEPIKHVLSNNLLARTEKFKSKIESFLQTFRCFSAFPPEKNNILSSKICYAKYEQGRVISKQGHPIECFYLILSGKVAQVKSRKFTEHIEHIECKDLYKGYNTDIQSCLDMCIHQFTLVVSSKAAEVLFLERAYLLTIFEMENMESSLLTISKESLPWLQNYLIALLLEKECIIVKVYRFNDVIIASDDKYFAIVETGVCLVRVSSNEQVISYLRRGNTFGLKTIRYQAIRKVQSKVSDNVINSKHVYPNEQLVSQCSKVILIEKNVFIKCTDYFTLVKMFAMEVSIEK